MKGARKQAWSVVDHCRLLSITANLGDTKTTITHPASTTHGRISPEARAAAGIGEGLLRIAPGPLERASACFRVLGASHAEWFVTLPLERLVEPYLHDALNAEVVGELLDDLDIEAVTAAGDEVGVGHAQMAQDAAFPNFLEVVGEGAVHEEEEGERQGAPSSG